MAPLSKRKRSIREVTKERERQRKARKRQEERGWEPSEVEEDVTALGLSQRNGAGSASDLESEESENDEVLVSEGEEQEEVDESAFGKLMASAVEQSMYVYQWFFSCPTPELTICHAGKQTSEAVQF